MTNKAYIVANKQQEREVLDKLEREGLTWIGGHKATQIIPSNGSFVEFPYVLFKRNKISWGNIGDLINEKIVYDGRKEEKMADKYVVSREFMNELEDWKLNTVSGIFINDDDIEDLPYIIVSWWIDEPSDKENNNRLIAIIRWLNGEDVFEVEKPKKWVVRSKVPDDDGCYWYVSFTLISPDFCVADNDILLEGATRFNTKEEAESWANSHQEVVQVEVGE